MKKLLIAFTAAVMLFSVACLAACAEDPEEHEPTRYDVVVQIKNSLGEHWIFDLATDELTCEYSYTGAQIDFDFDSFNLPEHPLWSEDWLTFNGNYHDATDMRCRYFDAEGNEDVSSIAYRPAQEKGEYIYEFRVQGVLFKYRSVQLKVTVS